MALNEKLAYSRVTGKIADAIEEARFDNWTLNEFMEATIKGWSIVAQREADLAHHEAKDAWKEFDKSGEASR